MDTWAEAAANLKEHVMPRHILFAKLNRVGLILLCAGTLVLSGCIKQRHAIVDPPPPQNPSTVILEPK